MSRAAAFFFALGGLAIAYFVEYFTPRDPTVERSFGWFAYEAAPWVVLLVLGLFAPYRRTLMIVGLAMLGLEYYAFHTVFVANAGQEAALIYLNKPFIHFGMIGAGLLAGFILSRGGRRN